MLLNVAKTKYLSGVHLPPHKQSIDGTSARISPRQVLTTGFCALMAVCCAASMLVGMPRAAYAEDIDTDPTPSDFQLEVERTAQEYNDAVARAEEAQANIEENEARIAELEGQIAEQQQKSDDAARYLYKMQRNTGSIVDLILQSQSFDEFVNSLEYMNMITTSKLDELAELKDMQEELDNTQAELEAAKQEADVQTENAEEALQAAQAARVEAQRKAEEEATRQAEQAAAAEAAQQAASASSDEADTTSSSESVAEAISEAGSTETATSDGADWTSDEATFVNEWASRIDAYLAGSPLAGQGRTFAQAAWNYGVDPRWSPAIAYTESSLGLYCFLPYNAWGWGSSSWSSWEEAINDHVRGLARGYGYTISMEAAQKYCPSNATFWYETTLAQMEMI